MNEIIVKTLAGLEDILAEEIKEIGGKEIKKIRRAVSFKGDKELIYKSNIYLRTALKVLMSIKKFRVYNQDDLYEGVKKIKWTKIFSVDKKFAVNSVVNSPKFPHSGFVSLKTKDAIVDNFRENKGERPSVDIKKADVFINVHISNNDCHLLLDTSGEPLFKRGYRIDGHKAPMNEVLAAGLIKISKWDKQTTFIDPMCGSGTLLIEAAMAASKMPAGYLRDNFSFINTLDYEPELWKRIKAEAHNQFENNKNIKVKIQGADIDPFAIISTRKNIANTPFRKFIELKTQDFKESEPEKGKKIIICNPPYGERIETKNIENFYNEMASHFKHKYQNSEVWILSSNKKGLKSFGLKAEKKIDLFNGSLPCKFQKYSIYEGSKKSRNMNKF